MGGQFQGYSGSCTTGYESFESLPTVPGEDEGLAGGTEQMPGDDFGPDALFLEETWTLGAAAAVERRQQRRRGQADRERRSREFRELDTLGSLSFVDASQLRDRFYPSARASVIAGSYGAEWSQQLAEAPAAGMHGWMQQPKVAPGWTRSGDASGDIRESILSSTERRACRVLGVAATSTREQIKAAYRRMVRQWHPDRLVCRTEEARRLANDQMAAINEAYGLLCRGFVAEAEAA